MPDKLHQINLINFPLREVEKQEQVFNSKWFDQLESLHYRKYSDLVVCHTCAVAK